ncbi:unnamed protein product [Blepharisma stoltei]|uniref:RING-type domain-containing protein n=1 Tax=Blepharisma stoltei TaxID=1481888 RepID=A0AAU9JRW1_9CILI|nr:unnamed protein product [Blepharisma stoltei]
MKNYSLYKCSAEDCSNTANVKCSCSPIGVFLCAEHLGIHLIKVPGQHNYQKLFEEANPKAKEDGIKFLLSKIMELKDIKNSLMKRIFNGLLTIENNLMTNIALLDSHINYYKKYISTVRNANEINSSEDDLKWLALSPLEAVNYLKRVTRVTLRDVSLDFLTDEIYKFANKNIQRTSLLFPDEAKTLHFREDKSTIKELVETKDLLENWKNKHNKLEVSIAKIRRDCDIYKQDKDIADKKLRELTSEKEKSDEEKRKAIQELQEENLKLRKIIHDNDGKYQELMKAFNDEREYIMKRGGPRIPCGVCRRFFYEDQVTRNQCGCICCKFCNFPPYKIEKKMWRFSLTNFYLCLVCNKKRREGGEHWKEISQ